MSYIESLLVTGEEIVYTTKKHWIAPLFATVTGSLLTFGGMAALVLGLAASGVVGNMLLVGGAMALVVGLALLGRAFYHWWTQYYFVTNQKVMKVEGLLSRSTSGSALEKINDITMDIPLLGRWLGYGTVRVLTAADESNLTYTAMRQPETFRKVILDQKRLFEQQDARAIADAVRQSTRDNGGNRVQSPDDIADLIARLARLRDSGAITPQEYEAKKAELLDRL